MSKMKRLASLVLAVMLTLVMSIPAFAATDYSITVNNSVEGYTYVAYQIFTGEYDDSSGILSNIEWGDGVDSASLLTALQSASSDSDSVLYGLFSTITDSSSAEDVAEILASSSFTNNSATTVAFSELVETCIISGTGAELEYNGSAYVLSDIEAGYYLVLNTAVPDDTDDTDAVYSRYMLRVAGAATVNPKSGVPTSSKTVDDTNESTGTSTTGGTTADYAIGDDVPFTLTAEVPSYFGDYDTYTMIFHDTLSDGLSFNSSSVVVTVAGTIIPATVEVNGSTHTNYTVETDPGDGCSFHVTVIDLYALYDSSGNSVSVSSGDKVIVTYTATLTTDAGYEETNTMYLEYSNNPYDSSSTGKTPEEIVTVLDYTLVITKTANNTSTALTGATFTLYKYDYDTGAYVEVETIAGTDTNVFTFSGLDEGQYKLVETVTPAGYNTMDDLYFKVEATHSEDAYGNVTVSLNVYQTDENGTGVSSQTQTFSVSNSTGTISATVINESGSSLPVTGGIGTTIFYIVGGVLVCGAVILLVSRRRMGAK